MNEFQHRIAEQKRVLPVIEAPCHFVKVSRQMFLQRFDATYLQSRV